MLLRAICESAQFAKCTAWFSRGYD